MILIRKKRSLNQIHSGEWSLENIFQWNSDSSVYHYQMADELNKNAKTCSRLESDCDCYPAWNIDTKTRSLIIIISKKRFLILVAGIFIQHIQAIQNEKK